MSKTTVEALHDEIQSLDGVALELRGLRLKAGTSVAMLLGVISINLSRIATKLEQEQTNVNN